MRKPHRGTAALGEGVRQTHHPGEGVLHNEDGCLSSVTQPCLSHQEVAPGKSRGLPPGHSTHSPEQGHMLSLGVGREKSPGSWNRRRKGSQMRSAALRYLCRRAAVSRTASLRAGSLPGPTPGKWKTCGPGRGLNSLFPQPPSRNRRGSPPRCRVRLRSLFCVLAWAPSPGT